MVTCSCHLLVDTMKVAVGTFIVGFFLHCMFSRAALSTTASRMRQSKHLWIVRHGQALHNPRAEAAKEAGCSFDEFLELMRQDDALDADLTELGRNQARDVAQTLKIDGLELIVSSPLSRAIETADIVVPANQAVRRVAIESFREINGWLVNAKRRSKTELGEKFPLWDFGELSTEQDALWTEELESQQDCSERGYRGLCWIMNRPEHRILLACHGGILRYTMDDHPMVRMVDGRTNPAERSVKARFSNCEVRRYRIESEDMDDNETIVLTELDF